jgi:hypothetical protein
LCWLSPLNRWHLLAMNRNLLAVLVLALSALACMEQVVTPTPAALEPSPTPTPSLVPTATRRAVTPSATAEADVQTTTIQATVYVRQEPDPNSAAIGSLTTGERVVIVNCQGDWCELERGGWVWRGCTDDNPEALLCEARP